MTNNKLRKWIKEIRPSILPNSIIFKNSHLQNYNLYWKTGLRWSVQILFLITCYSEWLSSSYFSHHSIDAVPSKPLIPYPAIPQMYCSISQQPSLLQLWGKVREKGNSSPREREERSKTPVFPSQDINTCQSQVSELPGEEKIKGRIKRKKYGK